MEQATILHIADVHIGGSRPAFGTRVSEHHRLLQKAFANCIDLALQEDVDAVCIAGDLFVEPRPSERSLNATLSQIQRLAEEPPAHIPCIILPGNHDCLGPDSVYHRPEFDADGIHLFKEPGTISPPGLPIAFHGNPQLCDRSRHDPLENLAPALSARWNVALAHGAIAIQGLTDEETAVIDPQAISNCGMDYIALGHWHDPSDYSRDHIPAWFSGATEIVDISQKQPGGALVVTLMDAGVSLRRHITGALRTDNLDIDADMYPNEQAVAEKIAARADEHLLLDVDIVGLAPDQFTCDEHRLQQELQESFFRLRVRDRTAIAEPERDAEKAARHMIATKTTQILRQKIQQARRNNDAEAERIARKALQLATALFAGKQVLQ